MGIIATSLHNLLTYCYIDVPITTTVRTTCMKSFKGENIHGYII